MQQRQLTPRRQALRIICAAAAIAATPAALWHAAPAAAASGDVFASFSAFLAHPRATLRFQQVSLDRNGTPLEQTDGTLSYQRPNKFRLQYSTPDNPLIVSDGGTMWVYEEELEQVIRQPFAQARKNGLIEVLASGDLESLRKNYVLAAGVGTDLRWLNAEAIDNGAPVRRITLGFDSKDNLRRVVIADHFDSVVQMQIEEVEFDITDPEGEFSFTPPSGSEVIDAE